MGRYPDGKSDFYTHFPDVTGGALRFRKHQMLMMRLHPVEIFVSHVLFSALRVPFHPVSSTEVPGNDALYHWHK